MKKKKLTWIVIIIILLIAASFIYVYFKGSEDEEGLASVNPSKGRGCISNGIECGDCIDNDGDAKTDYAVNKKGVKTGDSDCDSLTDDCESVSCCIPETCQSLGKNCEVWSDGCGTNIDCGTCPIGQYCLIGTCKNIPSNSSNQTS